MRRNSITCEGKNNRYDSIDDAPVNGTNAKITGKERKTENEKKKS